MKRREIKDAKEKGDNKLTEGSRKDVASSQVEGFTLARWRDNIFSDGGALDLEFCRTNKP